jgi:DNA (cytosine-5)-methyltransferase 1
MKSVGLFAGIGGMELGLQAVGFETNLLCEILPEAQAVLRARFNNVDLRSDIKKLRAIPGDTTLLCAGFPCQDLSSSGQKKGIAGLRSSLIGEVFRLLKKTKCEWVLLENVKFMLHLGGGEAISNITQALEGLGYRWAYRVMNSENYGVPQRRERIYILASRTMRPENILFREPLDFQPLKAPPIDISAPVGFYWTEGAYSTGLAADSLPPLKGGSTIGIPSSPAILFPDGTVGTPDIRDAERIQGFPEDWTQPAEQVLKSSYRWKLVGNAVTVNVCKWIAEGIASPPEVVSIDHCAHTDKRWPLAAFGQNGKVWRVQGAHGPVNHSSLATFLMYPTKPLSLRAVSGFLGRAQKGNLNYPDGFLPTLKKYAASLESFVSPTSISVADIKIRKDVKRK